MKYMIINKEKNDNSLYLTWVIPFGLWLMVTLSACKKFITVDPPFNSLTAGNVYLKDATAAAVLTNIYANMSSGNSSITSENIASVPLYTALNSDELILFASNSAVLTDFYRNSLTINTSIRHWNAIYKYIFIANNAIEGLNASTSLTPSLKQQLLGEAFFLRAYFYFYLVNLYGDSPLILSTDWKVNSLMSRTPITLVYNQIIEDLKAAQSFLSENFLDGTILNTTAERVRPTKWAARALLARVYLYTGDWLKAETEATTIINNNSVFRINLPLGDIFKKNSYETIWALQPVGNNTNSNTGEGKLFILPASGPNVNDYPVYLSNYVINAFEAGDLRKVNWSDSVKPAGIAYYFAKKYKIGKVNTSTQEYSIVLRLAEQYLIRAEARARQNKITEAQADLNVIRSRAGLPNTASSDASSILASVLHERQVELFTESGHRWFDLKRINAINAVMAIVTPVKANGNQWMPTQSLYPIPQTDINNNPNLIQNPGY